ncbi:glycosyltransferase family 4 protein [Chryseobacterium sp. H3056]|uniref:Glycosyltransferase family 4 protein n=1 Tax=Kaistella daneshvariae TaxID=2487074 RepID=A0A3N0WW65_9FLAO|nr:glycosyltransferase family 4 protein [Kaistella daneshvariae]ROI09223.1 glycosyltransferase family 4 protein [Kaistella daneshvariae]
MKLLYITNGITGAGGLERVLAVKAFLLAEEMGYQVHILSLNEEGKDPFFKFSPKIIRHSMPVGGHPVQYIKAYRSGIQQMVSVIKPDIISVCDDGLKGFFIPAILRSRIPVIYERHVSKLTEIGAVQSRHTGIFSALKFRLMNHLAKSFDRFVVLTEGNKKEWTLNNMKVIPNPLPFYPEKVSTLRNKKVIAVGKQSYQKAYDLLLESWAILPEELKDWELHIYGKKNESLHLEALAGKLGIGQRVFFHSPTKDIEKEFLESSVLVLSSRFEGFGMVIIEAMSCGLPVVSFDCPHGPGDIISHGSDGFLARNGDTEELSKYLSLVMEDSGLRQRLGSRSRETVREYLPRTVVKQWDDLFKRLVYNKVR